jgi:hypothetical protein
MLEAQLLPWSNLFKVTVCLLLYLSPSSHSHFARRRGSKDCEALLTWNWSLHTYLLEYQREARGSDALSDA